jgi:hypothetical protein
MSVFQYRFNYCMPQIAYSRSAEVLKAFYEKYGRAG